MPRSKSIPTYRYHISAQAIVTFCQKNFYLGPHNSQDSFARYNALVAEYIANGMVAPPGETLLADKPLTVACITAANCPCLTPACINITNGWGIPKQLLTGFASSA